MTRLQDALSAVTYAAAVLGTTFVLTISAYGFARTATPPDFSAMFDTSEPAVARRHESLPDVPVAAIGGDATSKEAKSLI